MAMRMSLTPRFFSSDMTRIQNFAPSVCSIQIPSTSLRPSDVTPIARYTALLRTVPSSRILTRRASKNTSAKSASSGRLCQRPTSSSTASVTVDISCGEASMP